MIYITGCAKSGTTLLRRMFFSFRRCGIVNTEIELDAFVTVPKQQNLNGDTLIGKRTVSTVFSNIMFPKLVEHQLGVIKKHDVKILNIIRDGRDAILSDWISPERWIASIEDAETYKDYITLSVYFEDLVRQPDKVQAQIAETFGLEAKDKFSNYPDFMTQEDKGQYEKYKLSEAKIGQDLEFYKKRCPGLVPRIDKLLRGHNYIG